MIGTAQDLEKSHNTAEIASQASASDRIEGSEDGDTAPELTWKGCDSDSDGDVDPPSTPPRDINVIIYTPSRTWTPADAQANSQSSPPLEDVVPDAGDDNTSVFSMTHYGSLDWDHSGDELDEIQVASKATRRRSTVSPNNQTASPVGTRDLDPITPRNKTGSISSTSASTSKKTKISVQRDSKGRFSRKDSSSTTSQASSSIKQKRRRASMSLNSTISSVARDAHGRFAPKNGTPAKRHASMGSSTLEKAPHSLERDSKGRFAPKKETPIPPPKPLAKRRASTSAIPDLKPLVFTRDAKGKFASKQPLVPPPQNSEPAGISSDLWHNGWPRPSSKSKPTKTKKAPAKSPYFASLMPPTPLTPPTPPISPELTQKSKVRKGERAVALTKLITPRKNNGEVPSSQGSEKKRPPAKTVSCIPFPPLSAPHFGLIQEKLAHDPFRLLIAVTFLIRTHGKHAIPVFFELMEKYPTPESLVAADKEEIVPIIRHLGLQNQRASTYQMYAKIWLEDPPMKGKRYAVRGYPNPESGRDVKKAEIVCDDDERDAWEIGHMTQGPYAIDSWRIFCRDRLRGEADGWNGEGRGEEFQPEWMRVLPEDKELRAYLRWMWLKEGFEWDPFTGNKEAARPELMRAAMEGRIAWDDQGGMQILDEPMSASPAKLASDIFMSQASTPVVRDSEESEDELL
jgi:methyl-CpG-binding domain protein 4